MAVSFGQNFDRKVDSAHCLINLLTDSGQCFFDAELSRDWST